MTTSAILFGLGLVIVAGYFIARPFRFSGRTVPGDIENDRLKLLTQKATIYAAIQEIDSDVAVGKLEVVDHRVLRQRYVMEGVSVLKALDALPPADTLDAEIDKEIAQYRKNKPVSGGFCPACGEPVDINDRFCASCGERLGR